MAKQVRPNKSELLKAVGELAKAEETLAQIMSTRDKQRQKAGQLGERLPVKADTRRPEMRQLVWELGLLIHSRTEYERAESMYREVRSVLEAQKNHLKVGKTFFGWLFSGREQKEACIKAFEAVRAEAKTGILKESQELKKELQGIRLRYSSSVCFSEFEANSAPYYALLEQLLNTAGELEGGSVPVQQTDGARGLLSEDLVRSIEAFELDNSLLKVVLRNYQTFGVKYILHQKSVLLGDEMGLGKTVQAISVIAHLKAKGGTHFLVVCPVSVLINWRREIQQHSELSTMEIHGSDKKEEYETWLKDGGVAVSTYETLVRLELADTQKIDALIVDEAHYVKNPEAKRTKALQQVALQAEYKLFMTGTPLENKVEEMLFLISNLQPEVAKAAEGLKGQGMSYRFRETIGSVYLRRVREDVLKELPEKLEKEDWVRLNEKEEKAYREALVSENFMKVRQVSFHVEDIQDSSKAARLLDICENAKEEGRKVLVFSFFLDVIDKLKGLLGERAYGPITGAISADERQKVVDAFSAGEGGSVLLSQIMAGGVGLNIQAASVVVLCEPQWKPSIESQAISRVYRMGQSNSVLVHRLLADDTVDERMLELLAGKTKAFEEYAEESAVDELSQKLTGEREAGVQGEEGQGEAVSEQACMAAIVKAEQRRLGVESRLA